MDFEIIVTEIKQKLDRLEEKIETLCKIMLGDPSDETKPGFNIRLDRLEQSERFKNKVLWIMGGGLITALGQALFGIIQ